MTNSAVPDQSLSETEYRLGTLSGNKTGCLNRFTCANSHTKSRLLPFKTKYR